MLSPLRLGERDRRVASARARLGEAAFAAAWSEGRLMTLEQAVECALASAEPPPLKRARTRRPARASSTGPRSMRPRTPPLPGAPAPTPRGDHVRRVGAGRALGETPDRGRPGESTGS